MSGLTAATSEFLAANTNEEEERAAAEMIEVYFKAHQLDSNILRAHFFYIHWEQLCMIMVDALPDELSPEIIETVPRKLLQLLQALCTQAKESFEDTPIAYASKGLLVLACMTGSRSALNSAFDIFGSYVHAYEDLGGCYATIIDTLARMNKSDRFSKQDLKSLLQSKIRLAPLTQVSGLFGRNIVKEACDRAFQEAKTSQQRKNLFKFMLATFHIRSSGLLISTYAEQFLEKLAQDDKLFDELVAALRHDADLKDAFYKAMPDVYLGSALHIRLRRVMGDLTGAYLTEEIDNVSSLVYYVSMYKDPNPITLKQAKLALADLIMSTQEYLETLPQLGFRRLFESDVPGNLQKIFLLIVRPEILDMTKIPVDLSLLSYNRSELDQAAILLQLNIPKITVNIIMLYLLEAMSRGEDFFTQINGMNYKDALNLLIAELIPPNIMQPPASKEVQNYFGQALTDWKGFNSILVKLPDIAPLSASPKHRVIRAEKPRQTPFTKIIKEQGPVALTWSALAAMCVIPEAKKAAADKKPPKA